MIKSFLKIKKFILFHLISLIKNEKMTFNLNSQEQLIFSQFDLTKPTAFLKAFPTQAKSIISNLDIIV